jgi:hypothetical protein
MIFQEKLEGKFFIPYFSPGLPLELQENIALSMVAIKRLHRR